MQKVLTLFVAVAVMSVVSAANAQEAVYDYLTGNITFNGVSGDRGLTIRAPEDKLNKPNATNLGGAAQTTDTGLAGSISWANFGGFPDGALDAGNVIAPMTDKAVISFERQETFILVSAGELRTINDAVIPEPASVMLVSMGLVGLAAARRRS